ncbi:multidrug DMT transporter permease [Flavobacterium cupreum]|uniref:Glucose uptake protein n=2 Tax=Flavobacterium TaxID=237 RepID=A0A4Y7UD98_9FLAO|nr:MULTISPECIES: GRP family sugar transporter [Flavobacterium]RUT67978.1 multidrug DMT transporter permease [Flavobacterium cupreum]TCN59003.1 glucose uptake protein [Flavobacterium circumlabens]TEB44405.1 multidrug DMT transporter permease [Flavobacterium circumlabens]
MFVIHSYTTAILFCFITMLCWGSWANTTKLSSAKWRFELFYWDYAFGILILSLIMAFTLGSNGVTGMSFLENIEQADNSNLISAFIGGIVFNLANILLVSAISLAGMSVAFPVGIGIALILGVLVNYSANPQGNVTLLFGGVALIAIAILLNARAYKQVSKDTGSFSVKGLVLAIVAGVLMGFFYKYVAVSMATDFEIGEVGKLTPYTALVLFATGIVVSNFVFNRLLMRYPFAGTPLRFQDYWSGSKRDHLVGILGGVIWHLGMSFNIIASGKAGSAISYGLGQGATIVAAIWGIFIWKEFANATKATYRNLYLMLLLYVIGIVLIILAKN